jgi:hypothetical protein
MLKSRTNIVGALASYTSTGLLADIDDDARQRFIHRQQEKSVAANAELVAQRLLEGLAEHQPNILHGVVVIDCHIALGLHREVEQPVLREQREHVIEERDARFNRRFALAFDGQGKRNVRLRRGAADSCYALGAVAFSHASRVELRTRISASVPTLMRRNGAVKAWLGKWRTRTLCAKRKS